MKKHLEALSGAALRPLWHDPDIMPEPLAPITKAETCELLIVGGGFTGLWAAMQAKEQMPDLDVTLIEATEIGEGASGRNGGQIINGISGEEKIARHLGQDGARILWEMCWAGHDIIRERVRTYDISCDLKWGYLAVAIKQRHLQQQR